MMKFASLVVAAATAALAGCASGPTMTAAPMPSPEPGRKYDF